MPSSQRVQWAKFRVAAVALVAVLILLTLVYLLTGGSLLSQTVTLYMYLPDGAGLEKDAPIRVDGIDVGKVKSVGLYGVHDPAREVRVVMDIQRERLSSIPANSEAEISSDSLIGDKFVDISSIPSPTHLVPGGEIRVKKSTDMMKAIDIRDLEKQLLQVDKLLQDLESGRGPVGEFVHGRKMYDNVVKRFAEIEAAFTSAVAATTTVGSALYKDELYNKFFDAVMSVDATLARLQSGQGGAGHFIHDAAQYEEVRNSLSSMRKSVADLRAGSLLTSGDMYDDLDRSIIALIQRVDDFNANPAFNTSEAYDSLAGMAKEMNATIRDFRLHPSKYLRIKIF